MLPKRKNVFEQFLVGNIPPLQYAQTRPPKCFIPRAKSLRMGLSRVYPLRRVLPEAYRFSSQCGGHAAQVCNKLFI